MTFLLYSCIFFAAMLLYFKIAHRYNIIDKPNSRSSHNDVTIRGGGVIFLIAAALSWVVHQEYWLITTGVLIIGTISFIDDRITISSKIRLLFHVLSVTLLFFAMDIFTSISLPYIALLYVLIIGTINAYNFMDGINGITGFYSLIIFGGLQYTNLHIHRFVEPDLIWLPALSCLVFLYFNFRNRAKCFAGDVGSISIAFWILFLLLKLMLVTNNPNYALFLLIYGLDAITTIVFRIIRGENILEAHRSHFYQFLANEKRIPHLYVAILYGILQFILVLIVVLLQPTSITTFLSIIFSSVLIFVFTRFFFEGKSKLINK